MVKKIIMLSGSGQSSVFMYNGLQKSFSISHVIIEKKADRLSLLKNRVRRQGFLKVLGQVLFQVIIPQALKIVSKRRLDQIKLQYNLDDAAIPNEKILSITSINSKTCIKFLQKQNPDLIIVNGTRIISKEVLRCTNAIFINTHAGITPKYRGVHGGYWAIASDDLGNCGVTVHLVDEGIDTGKILYQEVINPTGEDNFITYPYLQVGEGIKLMKIAITDFLENGLQSKETGSESKLWYHPTIWNYLSLYLTKKVK